MSKKLFLFQKKELALIAHPRTRSIGLSDTTWEEATRFMLQKQFASMITKIDARHNFIGYEVIWLEKGEQGAVERNLPPVVFKVFQSVQFGEEFISFFIETARRHIRSAVT